MKKLLLLSLLVILNSLNSFATHLMGGEITYIHLGGDDYEVTLIVYNDCFGSITSGNQQDITFESASCGLNTTQTLQLFSQEDVSQLCPSAISACDGGTNPGVLEMVYKGIIQLPPCNDWIIHWNSNDRNAAITNLINPEVAFYIASTLNNIDGADNNSPQFFALPTPFLCDNQLKIFNHGASDADGDSLYYSFNTPLTTPGPPGTPMTFAGGYSLLEPMITTAGMNLNQETGEMCFTPNQPQVSVVSILVQEYRNNILIGTQIREMQVIVSGTCVSNNTPSAGGIPATCDGIGDGILTFDVKGPSVDSLDANSFSMCPEDSICFTIPFSDMDGDTVFLSTNIASAIPGANFTISGDSTQNASLSFCWVPTPLDSGINVFTVEVKDDACPISASLVYTFDITVYDQPYAGPDQIICGDQTAQLNAVGGAGYTWFDLSTGLQVPVDSTFSCNPCANPIASPTGTTTYYVVSSLTAACENTDTITISRVADFTPVAIGDTALCDYLSHQIGVNIASGPTGIYTYDWNNESTLDNDTLQTPTASPTETTWYVVEVVSPDGCVKKVDSVEIIVTPPPTVTMVPGDSAICQGESLNFDVSLAAIDDNFNTGFDASLWESVSGATVGIPCVAFDGSALNFDAANRELTTNPTNVNNCTTVDFCLFIANDASTTPCENADAGEDVVLNYNTGSGWITLETYNTWDWDSGGPYANSWQCFSVAIPAAAQTGSTQFQWAQIGGYGATLDHWALDNISISCGGNTSYTYSWTPGTDLTATNISNPIFTGNTVGPNNYTVTITDTASGCSIDRNQTITVVPDYVLTSTQSDTNICLGQSVDFETIPNPSGSYSYSWSPSGIMNNDTITNPIGTFLSPGANMVIATVNSAGGCSKSDTMIVNVSYGFSPEITIDPDTIILCGGDSAQIELDLGGGIPATCGASPSTACSGATSQITVGTGSTNISNAPSPFYGFYEDSRVQMIYEAAELNALGFAGGKITEIAFEITTKASSQDYQNLNIKMGCTSTSDFTGVSQFETGLTQVFNSASYPTVAGQNTFILNTAYEWDGVSNLIVELCFDNNSYTSTDQVAQTATSQPLTLADWADGVAGCSLNTPSSYTQRPNITINHCPTTPDPNIYSYVWTPSAGLSDSTIKNPLASPDNPTMYYVTVIDTLGGCSDMDSVYVAVGNDFTAVATIDTSICIYDGIAEAIQLMASPDSAGYTFSWTNGSTLTDSTIKDPIASPTSSTDYIVTITNAEGCERMDTATINVFNTDLPILIQGDTNYCAGDSATLYVGNYDSYAWHNMIDTSIIISTSDTNNLIAGDYNVTVSSNGCFATSNTVTVNEIILTPPTLTDASFCENDSTTIDAGAGFDDYLWIPSGGNNQTGLFYQAGNYSVIVTTITGSTTCSDTSNQIEIVAIETPNPQILGDTNYCGTNGAQLSVNPVYDNYTWSTGDISETTTAFANGGNPTTITLTVDSNNCSATASVIITNPQASPVIFGIDTICPDSTILLTVGGGMFDSQLWSPTGDTSITTQANPGNVSVTVVKDNCQFIATGTVPAHPLPVASFSVSPENSGQPNQEIVFTDNSSGHNPLLNFWNFDATGLGTVPSEALGEGPLVWTYGTQGTYTITLDVSDNNGCRNTTSQEYLIFTDIITPNVITPNGDDWNDFLVFKNLDASVFPNNLVVFNRWGNQVFQQSNYLNDWDGGDLSDGTYFYILEVDFNTGKETFKGAINILR